MSLLCFCRDGKTEAWMDFNKTNDPGSQGTLGVVSTHDLPRPEEKRYIEKEKYIADLSMPIKTIVRQTKSNLNF